MPGLQIQPDMKTPGAYFLSGNIDAYMDLSLLRQSSDTHLILILKEIAEINSVGVKKWVEGLRSLSQLGKTIEYRECSEVFVEQCNFASEFTEGVKVHSFMITFMCEDCNHYEVKMLETLNLNLDQLPPSFPCKTCNQDMITEELQVFSFLEKK